MVEALNRSRLSQQPKLRMAIRHEIMEERLHDNQSIVVVIIKGRGGRVRKLVICVYDAVVRDKNGCFVSI